MFWTVVLAIIFVLIVLPLGLALVINLLSIKGFRQVAGLSLIWVLAALGVILNVLQAGFLQVSWWLALAIPLFVWAVVFNLRERHARSAEIVRIT